MQTGMGMAQEFGRTLGVERRADAGTILDDVISGTDYGTTNGNISKK
jgi:hypothetical protein